MAPVDSHSSQPTRPQRPSHPSTTAARTPVVAARPASATGGEAGAGHGPVGVRSPRPAAYPAGAKRPLPAGRPREWYEAHNRQLKAMRLAIALLDSGVHTPAQARNRAIRRAAARTGLRPPSQATCRLVRSLLP